MARRRFEDDDDFDEQPGRGNKGGGSSVAIILAVVGGLVLLVALVCGGVMILGFRQARVERAEMQAEMARIDAEQVQEAGDLARRWDADEPVPNGVPPQPPASRFSKPGEGGRWLILFRSADPALWNTGPTIADEKFALPIKYAPLATKYLRLRRMDTGEFVIVPMTRTRIGKVDAQGTAVRWNGANVDEHGGRHLGIANGPSAKWLEGKGLVAVLMDGWDATSGSGFGHGHHIENGSQKFAWKGKEIDRTAFEVAVTTGELTDDERAALAR